MMGPPGAGKSTLLQLLAGMLAGHAIKVRLLPVRSVTRLDYHSRVAGCNTSMTGDCWLGIHCYEKTGNIVLGSGFLGL